MSDPGKGTDGQRGLGESHINAAAIVGNLQQLQTSVLDQNLEGRGSCVYSVFHQLLQGMDRGHNDFSGRDLVDDILVESLGRVGLSNPTPMPTTYETANKSYLDSTRSGRVIKGDIGFPLGTTGRIHVHGITHHVVRHVCVYGRVGVCARERWGWPGAKTGSLSLNASFARFCPLLPVFFLPFFSAPALTCGRSLLLCGSAQLVWDPWER